MMRCALFPTRHDWIAKVDGKFIKWRGITEDRVSRKNMEEEL